MKLSSLHHHHNDLMTTTPPSELKIQGIVSSQTQRQAELTSRGSQCLLQWPSVAGSIINSCCSQQPPSAGKNIESIHLCREVELTSSSRFILEKSESSGHCINISEGDDSGTSPEVSVDSHQGGRSSLTMVIRFQRRVEFHRRAEEHQSVIVLDHIFIANSHHSLQTTSEQRRHDIARRVSSNIRQPESSSRDPNHQRVISLSVIRESISVIIVTKGGHLALVFITNSAVTLLHQHQVWPAHSGCLLTFHLCLRLLLVHLAHLSVLGRPQLHHLEDRDRAPLLCGVHHCRMLLIILHLASHILHLLHEPLPRLAGPLQSHLEYHQLHAVQHRLLQHHSQNLSQPHLGHLLRHQDSYLIYNSHHTDHFLLLQHFQQQHLLPFWTSLSVSSSRP